MTSINDMITITLRGVKYVLYYGPTLYGPRFGWVPYYDRNAPWIFESVTMGEACARAYDFALCLQAA